MATKLQRTVKDQSGAGRARAGEMLMKAGHITQDALDSAKSLSKKNGIPLTCALIRAEAIEGDTLQKFLVRHHSYKSIDFKQVELQEPTVKRLPVELASQQFAILVAEREDEAIVAMLEPTDTDAVQLLQEEVGKTIHVLAATEDDILGALKKFYNLSEDELADLSGKTQNSAKGKETETIDVGDLGDLVSEATEDLIEEVKSEDEAEQFGASDAPIIKLVNSILVKAVTDGVSDIHIEPFEKQVHVRYRKDGALFKSMNLPLSIKNALTSRLKILSKLNITERRVPQDGRVRMKISDRMVVDFRVSTLPTLFGEGIVLRILDKSSLNVDLTKLGFTTDAFRKFQKQLKLPQGLLLVTGPTGSGKTVTLYSALNSLNTEDVKILTAEDPVEFNFRGINQVNVNNDVGMTFAAALKSFLRQDPDIIMVGEIRDFETAEIAIKAAMTGHLVFSTLHTNDCIATIGRLINIGIPPFMVASAVSMILAQRLGRKLCDCKKETGYSEKELLEAGFREEDLHEKMTFYKAVGCTKCGGIGHKGRCGLFELIEVTEELGKAITAELPESQLRKVAIQEGMATLRMDALLKVKSGVISLEEALKRTVLQKESLPAYLVNPDIEVYENDSVIIMEGNTDKDFFKLIRGSLTVSRGGRKIAEITEPESYFGEMSAISGTARTATIRAAGIVHVKRFPGDKLDEVIIKYPEISKRLFNVLVDRLDKAGSIALTLSSMLEKRK